MILPEYGPPSYASITTSSSCCRTHAYKPTSSSASCTTSHSHCCCSFTNMTSVSSSDASSHHSRAASACSHHRNIDTEAQSDRSHRSRRRRHGRHCEQDGARPSKCFAMRALEYLVVFFLLVGFFAMPGIAQIIVGSIFGGLSVFALTFYHVRLFIKHRRQAKAARLAGLHASSGAHGSPDSKDALLPDDVDAATQALQQQQHDSFLALSSQQRERIVEILQPILRQAHDQTRAFATALGAAYTAGRASWAQELSEGGIRLTDEESPLLDPNAPEYDDAAVPLSMEHSMLSPTSFETAQAHEAGQGSSKERQVDV